MVIMYKLASERRQTLLVSEDLRIRIAHSTGRVKKHSFILFTVDIFDGRKDTALSKLYKLLTISTEYWHIYTKHNKRVFEHWPITKDHKRCRCRCRTIPVGYLIAWRLSCDMKQVIKFMIKFMISHAKYRDTIDRNHR